MIQDIVFIAIAFITLASAIGAVALKNVFYNALSLIVCLFGVACIFIFLNSEFLAIIEVIVYIGAIAIAIIFAIMLSQTMYLKSVPPDPKKLLRSLLLAGALLFGLIKTIQSTVWPLVSVEGDYSMRAIGKSFLTTQILAFEAISLVLLIAIVGALLISNKEKA